MRYLIEHETRLDFQVPVQEHHCELRMTPRESSDQRVISHAFEITPAAELFPYRDSFGNDVVYFSVISPHGSLITRVRTEVETLLENPFDYSPLPAQDEARWYDEQLKRDPGLWRYLLHNSPATPLFRSLPLGDLKPPNRDASQPIQASLLAAMQWVHDTLGYQPGSTRVDTPLHEALQARAGVCQDFAHLMISLVRSWNVPARYVMGYMRGSTQRYEDSKDQEATHAWAEMLIPGAGWRGFDPTNRLCANQLYIPIAVGRDYMDAAPQRGTFKGSTVQETPKVRVVLQEQSQQNAPPLEQQLQIAQ